MEEEKEEGARANPICTAFALRCASARLGSARRGPMHSDARAQERSSCCRAVSRRRQRETAAGAFAEGSEEEERGGE